MFLIWEKSEARVLKKLFLKKKRGYTQFLSVHKLRFFYSILSNCTFKSIIIHCVIQNFSSEALQDHFILNRPDFSMKQERKSMHIAAASSELQGPIPDDLLQMFTKKSSENGLKK